jgi:hypothetical protein
MMLRPVLRLLLLLIIDATEPGMSGSPILSKHGKAVGVLVIGTKTSIENSPRTSERAAGQPILTHTLPGRLLSSVILK